jgi:hypothetical protein
MYLTHCRFRYEMSTLSPHTKCWPNLHTKATVGCTGTTGTAPFILQPQHCTAVSGWPHAPAAVPSSKKTPFRHWCQQIIADQTDPWCVHAQSGNVVLMAFSQNTTDESDAARPASQHIKRLLLCDFYAYFKLETDVSTEQRNINIF